MRVLLVSDIHSNLEAWEQVLQDAQERGGFDQVWSLGDVIGYGPDPEACILRLKSYASLGVAGNHDRAVVGLLSLDEFNLRAADACRWTARNLSAPLRTYLEQLPLTQVVEDYTLVHGSLRNPVWEYLLHEEAALATFHLLESRYCLVGHSHVPFVCQETPERPQFYRLPEEAEIPLGAQRLILNPGSVGQPRDGDPRAAYVLLDTDAGTATHHRVEYDIPRTQAKMATAGLDPSLAQRLLFGH